MRFLRAEDPMEAVEEEVEKNTEGIIFISIMCVLRCKLQAGGAAQICGWACVGSDINGATFLTFLPSYDTRIVCISCFRNSKH